ncbi:hypothetical protein GCM10023175_47840 [Pseudonocardia xishanensis]|uniref:Uncharacterized protein n=2 Tax=Pseudonocardia xishanensis TaxID=630995 RepID=A0ABP8RXM9_9PSEU
MSCLVGAVLAIGVGMERLANPVEPGQPGFTWVGLALGLGWLLLAAGPVGLQLAGAVGRRATWATAVGVLGALGVVLGNVVSVVVRRDAEAFYIAGTFLLFGWAVTAAVLALRTKAWARPWRGLPLLIVLVMAATVPFFGTAGPVTDILLAVMLVPYGLLGVALLRDRSAP